MTRLPEVRAAIVKAVPEIMDLSFGCELKRPDTERPYRVIEDMTWGNNRKEVWVNSVPFGSMDLPLRLDKENLIVDHNGEKWEIRGRPIALSDVLRAIAHSVPPPNEITSFQVGDRIREYDDKIQRTVSRWKWEADSLDEQSEETIAFLHSILCV